MGANSRLGAYWNKYGNLCHNGESCVTQKTDARETTLPLERHGELARRLFVFTLIQHQYRELTVAFLKRVELYDNEFECLHRYVNVSSYKSRMIGHSSQCLE